MKVVVEFLTNWVFERAAHETEPAVLSGCLVPAIRGPLSSWNLGGIVQFQRLCLPLKSGTRFACLKFLHSVHAWLNVEKRWTVCRIQSVQLWDEADSG